MMLGLVFDGVLVVVVLAVAIWIIAARQAFAAVVGFVAYGLLLSFVWVRLSAGDVALTEAAVGGGATGVLLLGAAARLRATEAPTATAQPGIGLHIAAGVLCAAVAAALATVVLLLPDPPPTLAPDAMAQLPSTGLGNPVTAVLLSYRAFDTLLEKVVLLLAVLGVWSLAPDRLWGGRPGPRHRTDPDGVLTFLGQLLPPVGIVIGIHLLWVGAVDPGGAFQAGAILAAMWVLAMRAGLVDVPPIGRRWLRLSLVAGPVLFLAVGFAGFGWGGSFLAYPAGYAKPLIIAVEIVLTLSIAVTIGLLVAGPPEREPHP